MSAPPFRRRNALARREQQFPNLTPMVDVVMVILVFFMAATTFAGSEWFLQSTVTRPASTPRESSPSVAPDVVPAPESPVPPRDPNADPFTLPPVKLFIDLSRSADGETLAEGLGRPIAPLRDILDHVRSFTEGAAADKIVLSIRSSPDVPWSDVVRVHEECVAAGITHVEISLP